MQAYEEILRALGRIEGELIEIRKLSERVAKLEAWQWWLRGGWRQVPRLARPPPEFPS